MGLSASFAFLIFLASGVVANDLGTTHPSPRPLTLGLFSTPEVQEPISLETSGTIPTWVSGSLYRGAAGSWGAGNYTTEHWFDGFSRNHRFEISNGRVEYRNRNASDEIRDFVQDTGLYPGGSFAGDPCKVIFGAFETTWRDGTRLVGNKSSGIVSVAYIANFPGLNINSTNHGPFVTLVSTTDGNALQQIDPVTLEPIELFTYQASNPELTDGVRSAAHPAHGSRGQMYNYVLDLTTDPPQYRVFEIDARGAGRIMATISDAPPAYIHSLFSTENYLILIVWQADIGPTKKPTYNLLDTFKPWNSTRETLFYVIHKATGRVTAKYTTETFFAFHQVNSFEDKETGSIIIDIPTMPTYEFLEATRLENLRTYVGLANDSATHDIPGTFRRYRLPDYAHTNCPIMTRSAVLEFEIEHKVGNIELPRINQAYYGKAYQYAYGVHIEKPGYFADSIVKIDTKNQTAKIWTPETNHMPSEPIFVAHPNATAEDDGVLVTIALDAEQQLSSLIIIDAISMEELGRAK